MQILKHEKTYIHVGNLGHFYLSTNEEPGEDFAIGYVNSNLAFGANNDVEYKEFLIMPSDDFYRFERMEKTDDGLRTVYAIDSQNAELTADVRFIEGLNVFKQTTRVKNTGTEPVRIAKLAAANVLGIGLGGTKYYENDNRFLVHYCNNRMQGEGQWQTKTLDELGVYPASRHPWEKSSFRIQSCSSWSTKDYYPLLIVEDREKGECWFFEREGAENWFIELSAYEGFNARCLCVSIGGADETLGWTYDLKAGETYETTTAVYGVVKGGFEEAVRELTRYKRKDSYVQTNVEVAYNDFMNCNWGQVSRERIYPLIDAAAELGAKIFCIDDGWAPQGSWIPSEDLFPGDTFRETIQYIKDKGMRPGVWFEFEMAGEYYADEYVRYRNGKVVQHHRKKADMRSEYVWNRLFERVDYVYQCGVRYIKNDHNNVEWYGSNYEGESPAEGTRRNTLAFYEFIKELRRRYPDLVIESCAAGGGREENGTLRYFELQSTSDQEDYRYYPSILIGTLAFMPPEKAGIWSYPYPMVYEDWQFNGDKINEKDLESFKDGRQTVFNMVNAMNGYMYLSGKLHLADEKNKNLIKEGIAVYNGYKDTLKDRTPAFVLPMKRMIDKSYNAVGLLRENGEDMLLSVWALEQTAFTLDLAKYGFKKLEKIYPVSQDNVTFAYKDGKLDCKFDAPYSACVFRLR